ncbi:transposase [Pseudomonas sp. GD03944]|uniref:REP-associated tyrosine transposase n=1 Tax=Pseudomonas sp. GD03944 TaxID=2975409 RepID=UPI002448174F|nr:transposase [Pseudomonas sp. GD03944]MDH1264617.1 transposase [Pseudomonas sp. GD03944]
MSHYRREWVPGGTYFFTVTLADRRSRLLVDEIALLRKTYVQANKRLPFTTIAICVLPDHLHAIWSLPDGDSDYSQRWALIKSQFSRALPAATSVSPSKSRKREKGIWQRRFWEHCIRDDEDLARHVDYIHYNPVKHGLVTQVRDWPYSSFHRYVERGDVSRDWGGGEGVDGVFGE